MAAHALNPIACRRIFAADAALTAANKKLRDEVARAFPPGAVITVNITRRARIVGRVVRHGSSWSPSRVYVENLKTGKVSHFYATLDHQAELGDTL